MQNHRALTDEEQEEDIDMEDDSTVDKQVIDQFVTASNTNPNDDKQDTDDNDTFGSDLDYLNRLLSLFTIWCSHHGGEVVPITASTNLIAFIQRLTNAQWMDTLNQKTEASDMKQIYIERVMEFIASGCKIYVFKRNSKFRHCAQNGIKTLLKYCGSD
eukprot:90635_1